MCSQNENIDYVIFLYLILLDPQEKNQIVLWPRLVIYFFP